jgi:acetoin utilization protein AcuB
MLLVKDIMTADPVTARPQTSLADVIGLMKSTGCRQVPVINERGALVGIITDRDVRLAMNSSVTLHERRDDLALLTHMTAEGVMTPNPLTVALDDPAIKAAELLRTYKFGGLPVMEGTRLVGILTVTDLLSSYIELLRMETAR